MNKSKSLQSMTLYFKIQSKLSGKHCSGNKRILELPKVTRLYDKSHCVVEDGRRHRQKHVLITKQLNWLLLYLRRSWQS